MSIFFKKRKGGALFALVFFSISILWIYTSVVFALSVKALKTEVWQSEHIETIRLTYIARSTTNAVVEAISDDVSLFVPNKYPINKHSIINIKNINPTSVDIIISGDISPTLIVQTKAINDKNQSSTVSAEYNTVTGKITNWRDSQ